MGCNVVFTGIQAALDIHDASEGEPRPERIGFRLPDV